MSVNAIVQLEIIDLLTTDAEQHFSQTSNFPTVLEKLASLLSSPFIIFTSLYDDKINIEWQFSNYYCFSVNNASLVKTSVSNVPVDKLPSFLEPFSGAAGEVVVDKTSLLRGLIPEISASQSNAQANISAFTIPFYFKSELVGLISYQAPENQKFEKNYPALFHVLKLMFIDDFKYKSKSVELKTYQTVMNLMPQRVFWKNKNSVYLGCNKAFADDASVVDPQKIIGLTDEDIFPEQALLYRSDDANTMNTREHLICSEEPQTHSSGDTIWLRTSKRPMINNEDCVIGVVGTYDDITQLKNIQNELEHAKDVLDERVKERTQELIESNKKLELAILELKSTQSHLIETEKLAALGSLVAGLAHEINTPLGIAVTGASHLEHLALELRDSVSGGNISKVKFFESCKDLISSSEIILRNLERASELVRNFKMIAVDQSSDEKRVINLHKYLGDVVNAMKPKTNKKNIKIYLTGDELFLLTTYPGSLAQIITNLIDNALMHAFSGIQSGQIKISYMVKDPQLIIVFQDNGIGIDEDNLKKVFEPFYTTKRGAGGSGLGLSIIHNIVNQQLNGKITCRSKKDECTQFIISLPLN